MLLTKEMIQAAEDIETIDIDCPEWGGKVRLKMMSAYDRDQYEETIFVVGEDGKFLHDRQNKRAKLLSKCIVDENNNLMFPNKRDIEILGKKSVKAINRLFDAAIQLNGISDEAQDDIEKK